MTILMLCKGTQVKAMTCGDYEFEVNKDGTATIIRYNGKDEVVEVPQTFVSGKGRTTLAPNTDVVIPNYIKIDGSKWVVTSIAKNAYKGNKYIKTVKIGKNVESIGKGAFKGCTKLKKVKMGKNVEKIGKSAFEGCKSLKKIIIPAATKKINKSHPLRMAFKK